MSDQVTNQKDKSGFWQLNDQNTNDKKITTIKLERRKENIIG